MPSAKNIAIVAKLQDQLKAAKSLVLADYRGLSVKDIQDLRSKIRSAGGSLTVAKNTLLKLALPAGLEEALRGPSALILGLTDALAPLKALVDFAKTQAANLPLPKAGIFDDRVLTAAEITILATLPSREQLLAQLAGQLQAPLYGLHATLQGNLRQLIYLLKTIPKGVN